MPFAPFSIPEGGDHQAGWQHDISGLPVPTLFKNEGRTVYKSAVGVAEVYSKTPRNGGKWYAEVRFVGTQVLPWFVGCFELGGPGDQGAYVRNDGKIFSQSGGAVLTDSGFAFPALQSGNTVCMAMDRINSKIWFRVDNGLWNNNASHNPDTNIGGFTINPIGYSVSVSFGDVNTAEFTIATNPNYFKYSIPSTFNSWYIRARKPDGWDTVNANPEGGMLLSNGNRTITTESLGITLYWGQAELVSVTTHRVVNRSKRYVEITLGGSNPIEEGHIRIVDWVGDGVNPYHIDLNFLNGNIINAAGGPVYGSTTPGPYALGTVFGIAVDFNVKKVWFKIGNGAWNAGVLGTQNPATNEGGIEFVNGDEFGADVFLNSLSPKIYSATINTGTFPFALGLPSGFEAWYVPTGGTKLKQYKLNRKVTIKTKKRKMIDAKVEDRWFEARSSALKQGWSIE